MLRKDLVRSSGARGSRWLAIAVSTFALGCVLAAVVTAPSARSEIAPSDLVFAGAAVGEPFAVWVSADRTRITRVMFYADSVRGHGGYDWVDFKQIARGLPTDVHPADDKDYLFAANVAADGSFTAGSDSNAVSYDADVTGTVTETVTGRLAGDRATGTFSATLRLQKGSG